MCFFATLKPAAAETMSASLEQRCWMHGNGNVLEKLPRALHPQAKDALLQVWMAKTGRMRRIPFTSSWRSTRRITPTDCLARDRTACLLRFPRRALEAHLHINPIESTLAPRGGQLSPTYPGCDGAS